MTSRVFDRAAAYYDQTRVLPEPMATGGIAAILDRLQTRRGARLLEVGAGTGRISIPLLQRGADLFGCDLSLPMLRRQQEKHPAARLAQADASQLPFESGSFDGLLTIHVLHLVGAWRAALREFARVLRPGGVYVNSWNWHAADAVDERLRQYWRSRVSAYGGEWRRPGIQSRDELLDGVRAMGGTADEVLVSRFHLSVAPAEIVESIASRHYSDSWEVPEAIFEQSVADLRRWAQAEYGDLRRPVDVERRFLLDVVRF
jgi:ubiquinone/menaquinone biosynthesis C-methylase UbiE